MEELLFECRYQPTEELSREAIRATRPGWQIVFVVIYALLGLRTLGMILVTTLLFGYVEPYAVLVLLLFLGALLYFSFRPRLMAKRQIRRIRDFFDGQMPEYQIRFTRDHIINAAAGNEHRIPYAKLNKVWHTKHILILGVDKVTSVAIPKNSFTKGSYEEFLAFLRAKCPDLKIHE